MPGSDIFNAAHVNPKVLVSQQMADITADTVYTVAAGNSTIIKHGNFCNVSGAAVNASLSLLKSGQSVDGTHRLINVFPIAAGDSLSLKDYIGEACLGPGDFIVVQASIANVLDVVISGVEYS